jgi:rod shape-determining protein MreD
VLSSVRHVLLLCLAFVLQTTWVHHIQIANVVPDLVLLVVVFIALTSGHLQATLLGFAIGLCQDTFAPTELGLNALINAVVGFSVGVTRGSFVADAIQVRVAILAAAVLVHDLAYYTLHSNFPILEVPYLMLRFSLGHAAYTAVFGFVVAGFLRLRHQLIPS